MAQSYELYPGDDSTKQFAFTKGYIARSHIASYVDGVSVAFTWVNDTLIDIGSPLALGSVLKIVRTTPRTPLSLTDFSDGANLPSSDLDRVLLQAMYVAQETDDTAETNMLLDVDNKYEANSKIIKNVADAVNAQDAVTKAQLDAAVVSAGSIPAPSDPTDNNKFLQANSGSYSWVTFVKSMISDATVFGRTWLGLADAASARTNLGLGSYALLNDIPANAVTGDKIAMGSDALGDLLYYNGTDYARFPAGADNYRLRSNGAGAAPSWAPVEGKQLLTVEHHQPQGTNGGGYTSGTFRDCHVTDEIHNDFTGSAMLWALPYDAQTGNFTVGQVVTGGTSGAYGTIVADTDAGATGTLYLINITGTFADNESITDPLGGVADVNSVSGQASADSVWLEAGEWYTDCYQETWGVGLGYLRIYDHTNAAQRIQSAAVSDSGYSASSDIRSMQGRFTVPAGGAQVAVQLRGATTRTNGFGDAVNFAGVDEVFAQFSFWKVS